jgi:CRP/FNR family transcriptional regulator
LQIINAIKNIELFNSLSQKEIDKLIDISDIREFIKDTIVYYEDDIDYSLQFLINGNVKMYKLDKNNNEIYLYNISSNTMISELSSLDEDGIYCFANAQFTEYSTMLSINFKEFKKHFINTNILTYKLLDIILKKNKQLHFILNRELVFDSIAKVSYMICNELEIFNKRKRKEIAFKLHIQPETLSRVINKLRDSNIIALDKSNKISIINEDILSNYFYGIGK